MTSTVEYGQVMEAVPVSPDAAPVGSDDSAGSGKFTVRLHNFTGPFDLLLQLIGKHKLDVTEVALHKVTDEFIAYIRAMGDGWDLDEASEFLIIAATLLDLKAARLLPAAQVEDEEDLALLEARDLLFARLLQYKAFKEAAAHIAAMETAGARRYPRAVALEARYADALPDLVLGIGPERLLRLAIKAMTPKPVPVVSIAHVHDVRVSVREHAALLRDRLRLAGTATFRVLCADCQSTLEVVARFLALLELYREGLVGFAQVQALGELTVRWTGGDEPAGDLDIDEYAGSPAASPDAAPSSSSDAALSSSPDAAPSSSDAAPSSSGDVPLSSSDDVLASSPDAVPLSSSDDVLASSPDAVPLLSSDVALASSPDAVPLLSPDDVLASSPDAAPLSSGDVPSSSSDDGLASSSGAAAPSGQVGEPVVAETVSSGAEAGPSTGESASSGAEAAPAGAGPSRVEAAPAAGAEAGPAGAGPGAEAASSGAGVVSSGAGDDVEEPQ